jgi:hypothetical protein
MSALELYSPITEFPNVTTIMALMALISALLFIQVKIHLMYSGELDRLKASMEKRITALQAALDNTINRLTPLEDATKTLVAAQGGVNTELCKQEELLGEHGEEISVVAEAAYGAIPTRPYAPPHILDEHIKNYLKSSKIATVRQIFKHLSEDKSLTEEWTKLYGEKAPKMTRQDTNRRLYFLLARQQLKMDSSAGPIAWSL